MSLVASLRERKHARIDYKNLHLGRQGKNMAAEENGDFIIEDEMTPVKTRLFKSKNVVSETEKENGVSNDDDDDDHHHHHQELQELEKQLEETKDKMRKEIEKGKNQMKKEGKNTVLI